VPLVLADELAGADLGGYLARLLRYDQRAVVRLRASGEVLAVFGRPPLEVITLRTVGLATPAVLDATVAAAALREGIDGRTLTVPPSVTGPPWTGLLPPRAGWREVCVLPAATVRDLVAAGVAEGRERIEALPAGERTPAALDAIAASLWARPIGGALPLRAAHAATVLGFMQRSEQVTVHQSGQWLRMQAEYGVVLVREQRGLALSVR
jgi:hypothetical protein